MRKRPLGITALAVMTVMVGIYSFFAAVALLITGSFGVVAGSHLGSITLFLGAAFLWLTASAYLVGGGLWLQRHWAWAGAMVVFSGLVIVNLGLSLVASNLLNSLLPIVGAAAAMWYLARPSTKAQLAGAQAGDGSTVAAETVGSEGAAARVA